jgi:hypothetical protein
VSGLCSDLERKNAESIAYHFGLNRKQIQHFIGESDWTTHRFEKNWRVRSQLSWVKMTASLLLILRHFPNRESNRSASHVSGAVGWGKLITVRWVFI